jgi:hypothetical protein
LCAINKDYGVVFFSTGGTVAAACQHILPESYSSEARIQMQSIVLASGIGLKSTWHNNARVLLSLYHTCCDIAVLFEGLLLSSQAGDTDDLL